MTEHQVVPQAEARRNPRPTVTVVVNTLNEELNLEACLASVSWADEIVVVDMESEDRTVEIARRFTSQVFSHPRVGYVEPARNFAVEQAHSEWVLVLDADERLTPAVSEKLQELLRAPHEGVAAIALPRRNYIGAHWIQGSGWGDDHQIRLFRKGKVTWSGQIHVQPAVEGEIQRLDASFGVYIHHQNYRDFKDFVHRLNCYTDFEAEVLLKRELPFAWEDALATAQGEFYGRYTPEIDKGHSMALAGLMAFYRFLSQIKAWERAGFPEANLPSLDAIKHRLFAAEFALMDDMAQHHQKKDVHITELARSLEESAAVLEERVYEKARLEGELADVHNSLWYRLMRKTRLYRPRRFAERAVALPMVSVILVNYNGKHFMDDCLASLEAQTYPRDRFEVIVVDNGSVDGSVDYLRERYPWVTLIPTGKNLGFAGGNNEGFRYAKGDLIALLNNDTAVDARWLEALVEALLKDPRIGATTSKILFKDNPTVVNNAGLNLYKDGSGGDRGFHQPDDGRFDEPADVFGACGASVLMRREMLDDIGWFDERFFMYYEDMDLAWRARIRGWWFRYTPASVVYHVHCGSSGEWSPFFLYHVERNRVLVNLKNAPPRQAMRVFASYCRRALRKWYLVLTLRERSERDRGQAVAFVKATISLAWEIPGMLWKRLRIRGWRRIVSDRTFAHLIEPNP